MANKHQVTYIGADIVPEFVEASARKYPESTFILVKTDRDVDIDVDHIVASGTFNVIEGDYSAHWSAVREALIHLFSRCSISLAVNFMTDLVDYQQADAFHISPGVVIDFVRRSLSCRFALDQSYMPYEFTVAVYKDARILRPDNVFEPIGI